MIALKAKKFVFFNRNKKSFTTTINFSTHVSINLVYILITNCKKSFAIIFSIPGRKVRWRKKKREKRKGGERHGGESKIGSGK